MLNERKSTILIIDSDTGIIKSLSDFLSSEGFGIVSASTTEMAYRLFLATNPSVVLLDINMKDSSGFEILAKIRPKAVADNIPLIALSTEGALYSKLYGSIPGISDYITKPLHFAEVLARINAQLKIVSIQKELETKNKELLQRNEALQQMAITDALTGLYNRAYILSQLHSDIAHCIRYREPLSFIMADLDHFKSINDRYGHLGGDKILKDSAQIIKNSLREVDIVARYGGEEFLIICPNTDSSGAAKVAERVRESISGKRFSYMNRKIHMTISLGVESAVFDVHVNAEEAIYHLIEAADKALYRAKAKGRNRVEFCKGDKKECIPLKKNETSSVINSMQSSPQTNDEFLN